MLADPDGALLERAAASFGMLSAWLAVIVGVEAASEGTVGEEESEGAIEGGLASPPVPIAGTELGVKLDVVPVP